MPAHPPVSVIILAAGKGVRAGGFHKQFLTINEKPLIDHSLDVFLKCSFVKRVLLVVPAEKITELEERYGNDKISIVSGGSTRRESIMRGLIALQSNQEENEYIIAHDAARPMISEKMIEEVLHAAVKHDGSIVGIPAIDLLFEAEENIIEKAYNKKKFYYGFTPQCFKFETILNGHLWAEKNDISGDCDNIEILKQYNPDLRIKIIDSFYPNIKLTYKEDIPSIETHLKNETRK